MLQECYKYIKNKLHFYKSIDNSEKKVDTYNKLSYLSKFVIVQAEFSGYEDRITY